MCAHGARTHCGVMPRGVGGSNTCLSIFCARQHARPAELSVPVSWRELCCCRATAGVKKGVAAWGVARFFSDFPPTIFEPLTCLLSASLGYKQRRILH